MLPVLPQLVTGNLATEDALSMDKEPGLGAESRSGHPLVWKVEAAPHCLPGGPSLSSVLGRVHPRRVGGRWFYHLGRCHRQALRCDSSQALSLRFGTTTLILPGWPAKAACPWWWRGLGDRWIFGLGRNFKWDLARVGWPCRGSEA